MAFLAPSPSRQPILNAPASVVCLIAGLGLAHAARVLAGPAQSADIIARFAFIPARYSGGLGPQSWLDQAVPFVSYMALHGGWAHLAINCAFLLAFGPIVARRFGTLAFLLFFLACGVTGALIYWATALGSPEPMIGASGAVYGLMAAGLRLLPTVQADRTLAPFGQDAAQAPRSPMPPLFSRQMLLFTLVWLALTLLTGIPGIGAALGAGSQIAWATHLGGFFAGLLLAGLFDRLAAVTARRG
jgi:membrane associated rhomboid family serine protease